MAKLKEKGHNINLRNIIIHKINKSAGVKASSLKLADEELEIDKSYIRFIADVRSSFQKGRTPTYGIFDDEIEHNRFKKAFIKYAGNDIDFMKFSTLSMDYYKYIIETSAPATGGFMIFADFQVTDNNDERYLLIMSINNKQGYNLSEVELAIQEIQNLDLSKMDLATIINISRWEISNQKDVKTYLSFKRGKKEISDYFQNFIGCADKTTATESSTLLKNTIISYFKEIGLDEVSQTKLNSQIHDYCAERNRNRKEILLSQISYLIDEDNPEDFLSYATDERFGNSEIIKYDSKTIGTLKYVNFDSDDLKLKFNKKLMNENGSIRYDKKKGTLTLSNLPEGLESQL